MCNISYIAESFKNIKKGEVTMNKKWLKAAGIRAVKTMAQTAVALIGTTLVISEVDWMTVASASVLAGLLSVLTSIAGLPEVEGDELNEN